jgi:serine/threonine protein kinase
MEEFPLLFSYFMITIEQSKILKNIEWQLDIPKKVNKFISKDSAWSGKLLDAGFYNQRRFQWLVVSRRNLYLPQSGWKLHVSASLFNAAETLNSVLPILFSSPFNYKVTANLDFLAFLNNNSLSKGQAGKFITIYVNDTSKAFELASALHKHTKHFKSPRVTTDYQFTENSNIYYRYGSFLAKYEQSLWGVLLPIMKIKGEKVFDFKNPKATFYHQLDNPFKVTTNGFEDAPQLDKQVIPSFQNGALLKCYRLSFTDTTETLLCLDIKYKRRCIVKTVNVNSATDSLGNDAVQRLKFEESILKKLDATGVTAKVYDSFFDGSKCFCLVMEDLPGDNLHQYLQKHIAKRKPIAMDVLLKIANNLAMLVMTLHKNNIIHADLKLGNLIILKTGEIKIIDFDSACDLATGKIISTCGSTGFCTKNREKGLIPTIFDDIYSYGAILYYLFGLVDPNICPLEVEQTDIALAQFKEKTPSYICDLISRCLKKEFNNFVEVVNFLKNEPYTKTRLKNIQYSSTIYSEKLIFLTKNYLSMAYDEQQDKFNFSQILSGDYKISDFRGLAGSLLALTVAATTNIDCKNLNYSIRKMTNELLNEKLPYNTIPGLYVGESGKALAMLYAAEILDDQVLYQKVLAFMQQVNQMPLLSVDLFNGMAGRIRVNLIFWQLTKQAVYLKTAEKMVTYLIESQKHYGNFIAWYNPSAYSTAEDYNIDNKTALLGYAHGLAGIADVLLDYYIITKAKHVKLLLSDLAICLLEKSYVVMQGAGLEWSDSYDGEPILSFWCHGGAGIGLFICRAMYYDIIPLDCTLINKILNPIISFTRGSAPILCHGALGSLESLLDFYYYIPKLKDINLINSFENIISVWLRTYINNGFKTCNAQFAFYGYLTGVAGMISIYSRLADSRIPNPLHLEFANYLLSRKTT